MKNLTTGLLALVMMIFVGLGCSGTDKKTTDNSSSSNDNKSTTNSTSTTSSNGDISGNYSVNGKTMDNQPYAGDLTIKKQGEVYQFNWNAGNSVYSGVGVRDGNLVAVGYGAGTEGKGCGAAIYKIGDKTLEGYLGGWGYSNVGRQSALLTKDTKDGSLYTVSGTDTDGSSYGGNLYIAKSKSDVYHFAYAGGKVKYTGTGIKVGDHFGAGLGIKKCGYVVYDVKGDRLEAAWGAIGDDRLGTEIATRK